MMKKNGMIGNLIKKYIKTKLINLFIMEENITSEAAAEKAMKNRCDDCKQVEAFINDSVHFNDGDHNVEDLIDFRKSGFVEQNGEKCSCYKTNENKSQQNPLPKDEKENFNNPNNTPSCD